VGDVAVVGGGDEYDDDFEDEQEAVQDAQEEEDVSRDPDEDEEEGDEFEHAVTNAMQQDPQAASSATTPAHPSSLVPVTSSGPI
jgi:hypothetical protein